MQLFSYLYATRDHSTQNHKLSLRNDTIGIEYVNLFNNAKNIIQKNLTLTFV